MTGPLSQFFTKDHCRLESLLNKATANLPQVEMETYGKFRKGLLRHIRMEERILFPAAKAIDEELMKAKIPRFRKEHGALTALMVPSPNENIIKAIRYVMERHDLAEEEPGGMYDVCEKLTQEQTQSLLDELRQTAEVPVHPHNDHPIALKSAKNALQRAGYNFDEIADL